MAPVSHIRGRRSGRWALAAAGAALALAATGCSILDDLRPGGGGEEEPTPEAAEPVDAAPLLEEALADLAEYPALTASGQVAASVGGDVRDTSLTVTDSGATNGTVSANDIEGDLVSADGKLYIRAAEDFWLDQGVFGPDFDDFDENWVRATGGQAGINPAATLAPPVLAEILGGLELDSEEATEENLEDVLTYRVDLAGERNQLWINAESGQIQRIAIEELVPPEAERGPQVRLDLAEADTAAAEEVYDTLTTLAEDELTGSRDARVEVAWDGQPAMNCEPGPNCTWSGTVRDAGGASSGTVTVQMAVTFSNDELGNQECSDSGGLEAGGTLEMSCSANYDSVGDETYTIDGSAQLSTRGLTSGQQEEMLTALDEQRAATVSGGSEEETEGTEGSETPAEETEGD
ncbi:hypothetical protein DFP74_6469 [Nocardiopsis sp. Huas11]|uniref:hypothetical protein n=1 Tax=Nocardiopsis sp. Huas11 TaxID=2183912 RepID=UPI000EB00933|nr:hypothetical protein [Nocardiopsis sp. Huas11]RKS10694.1 hypothetical protein DFP74_6469 [Nocardiopsis sp. Huas11]